MIWKFIYCLCIATTFSSAYFHSFLTKTFPVQVDNNKEFSSRTMQLEACRRNNKDEKRKRNREYARKFQSKTGESRKKVVVEMKRGIVAANEAKFQAKLYQLTTDDDIPAYSGFQLTS